jgi:hypothetical protein
MFICPLFFLSIFFPTDAFSFLSTNSCKASTIRIYLCCPQAHSPCLYFENLQNISAKKVAKLPFSVSFSKSLPNKCLPNSKVWSVEDKTKLLLGKQKFDKRHMYVLKN